MRINVSNQEVCMNHCLVFLMSLRWLNVAPARCTQQTQEVLPNVEVWLAYKQLIRIGSTFCVCWLLILLDSMCNLEMLFAVTLWFWDDDSRLYAIYTCYVVVVSVVWVNHYGHMSLKYLHARPIWTVMCATTPQWRSRVYRTQDVGSD